MNTENPEAQNNADISSAQASDVMKTATPEHGRFSIDDHGQILWQKDTSNPLPGHAVGGLTKGDDMFSPGVAAMADAEYVEGRDVKADMEQWLKAHIDEVLGGITRFAAADGVAEPLKDIAEQLKRNGGVVDRYKVERSLAQLDADMRRILRQHKVRTGPLLVFYQDLLKPAPLKLKSVLWAIANERDLPIKRPKDGIVSEVLEEERIDYPYYRMLGYPVFAKRAIRIDMLDRVVTDIYDQAEAGAFRAQHKYAEWLGCSLEALYEILESMGHYKVDDPAAEAAKEAEMKTQAAQAPQESEAEKTPEAQVAKDQAAAETAAAADAKPAAEGADTADKVAPAAADEAAKDEPKEDVSAQEQAKPLLALFKLKKGKLSTPPKSRGGKPAAKGGSERKADGAGKPKKGKKRREAGREKTRPSRY